MLLLRQKERPVIAQVWMQTELEHSFHESIGNRVEQVNIPFRGGDDVLTIGTSIKVGLNDELRDRLAYVRWIC